MDPNPKDPSSAGGDPDEFTIVRRRSRRVSFAETTAIHVFDRDEDFETPPDSKPSGEGSKPGSEELGFQGGHFDGDDAKRSAREEEDDDEEDDVGEQEKFIRDMDSSSPGSTAGSVTSNDDDNFFGPVSTSFIKSGQLSEAGMSDDNNHDITLDSTAFSMHFQNVIPPDDRSANSAGSLRTPTGDSVPTDFDGFVVSKGYKQQVPRSKFFDGKMSGSAGDSNNMSLIVENLDSYDRYGKLSPTLESLLAEAEKSTQAKSPISGTVTRTSQHDNHVPVVEESAEDDRHIRRMDATGMADDACFDSNLSSGHPMGTDSYQNGNFIHSPNKVAGLPIDALMNGKTQVTLSPKFNGYSMDVCGVIQSNAMDKDVQNTDMLSPPYRKSYNNLALKSGQVHQELSRDKVSGSKHSSDPSIQSMAILPAMVNVNGQQQLLSENGMQTPQNAVQPRQSLLPGSVSSLRSKRQQLFLDPSVLSQNRLMQTPDKEESLSFLKMKLIQHGERISAIKVPKSIIHKSPIIINSRSALSEKDPMPHELESTLEKNNDRYSAKHMGVSVGNKRDGPNIGQEASEQSVGIQLKHSRSPTTCNLSALSNLEENELVGGPVKLTTGISSVQVSQSEINRKGNLLSFDDPIERASMLDTHGSSVGQTTLEESGEILDTPQSTSSSPIRMLGDKLSASQGAYFTPRVDVTTNSSSSLERNRLQSSKSFTGHTSDKVSKQQSPKELENNDSPFYKFQEQIEGSRNFHHGNRDRSTVVEKHLVPLKDKLSVEDTISTNEPPLEDANKLQATVSISTEFLAERTIQSPNNKMDGDNNMLHCISPNESLPSKPTQDSILCDNDLSCPDLQSGKESHSVQTGLSGKKRGIEKVVVTDKDHLSEVSRIQKSPKVLPDVVGSDYEAFPGHGVEEQADIGGQTPQKHWTDILFKASEATKQLFPPSICKLNSLELDILEDILGELQTAKQYERLYTSLRNHNCFGELNQKRVAEARSLLDKLVYEKAKLQLKRMKLDDLCNKAQLCKLKIQECAKLNLIYSQFCVIDARIQHRESQLHSDSNNSCTQDQAEYNRVTSMRQELEMLDQKVKHMMKAFESSCKIKGNSSCDGIIKVVNDHMEMKNRCRLIQQDLQMWKLSDVVKENDQCNIVLNYCNVLSQRFTIYSRSVSSIVSSNFLNNAGIEKNFPNMNAHIAFGFIFKANGDRRFANSKQLSQETLETSLLLGTLLDVLEEVLVSRIQSWNLISSTFHLQCCQLNLLLSFLSIKHGWKVTLSLDLSVLNCATYPSEPSDFQIRILEAEGRLPPSISDEIMGAVESLGSGRSMIVRLCLSISKVVRDADWS